MKVKSRFIEALVVTIGIMIIGMGIAISLLLDLGVDTVTLCFDGFSKTLGITPGQSVVIVNIIVIIFVLILKQKHYINIGTLLMLTVLGIFIDFFYSHFMNYINGDLNFTLRIAIMFLSFLIIGYGVSLYTTPNIGVGATDLISVMISDLKRWNYKWVRIGVDACFFVVGYLLGGEFGIGTVASVFAYGPIIQFFNPINEKIVTRIINRQAVLSDVVI